MKKEAYQTLFPHEERIVINVFLENFWDLGIFRWMVRNKRILIPIYLGWLALGVGMLIYEEVMEYYHPNVDPTTYGGTITLWWLYICLPISVAGYIDNNIRGKRYKIILEKLKDYKIHIGVEQLLEICKDVMPK